MNIVVRHRISITDGHQRGTAMGEAIREPARPTAG